MDCKASLSEIKGERLKRLTVFEKCTRERERERERESAKLKLVSFHPASPRCFGKARKVASSATSFNLFFEKELRKGDLSVKVSSRCIFVDKGKGTTFANSSSSGSIREKAVWKKRLPQKRACF